MECRCKGTLSERLQHDSSKIILLLDYTLRLQTPAPLRDLTYGRSRPKTAVFQGVRLEELRSSARIPKKERYSLGLISRLLTAEVGF